ncbi:DUF3617 domain-containing protein [Sphingomonas sp. MMS12-HWE2-04]|uniref:DUF3617 domain-containing protein n=1 Tax=Sphingomonas sp. MMS12-HWE2-04 TaxID=3234199 RepID=UPI00384F4F09
MVLRRIVRPALMGALLVGGIGGASAQRPGVPAALAGLESGQWELKAPEGETRKICLGSRAALIQLLHPNLQCDHVLMDNSPRSATIRYTCTGHGNGRTVISTETPRLISIQTQGVIDGAPFAAEFEGRRVGACN